MGHLPAKTDTYRVVLLSGSEDGLRKQALRELLELGSPDPFDIQMLIAGEAAPDQWIAAAGTVPFMSDRRIVVVRNLLRASSPKEAFPDAEKALASLPDSARLILVADDESSSDHDRVQRLDNLKTAWGNCVKKAGGLVLEFKIDVKAVKVEIIRYADSIGKKLDDKAAELLLEMTGRSFSRAMEELDKVALYVGDAPKITEGDVAAAAMPSKEWSVFKLVDSIVEGNVGLALQELQILIGGGAKAEGAAMANIFPNLSRNFRLIWQARVCLNHRANLSNLPEELRSLMPDSPSLASISEWQQRRAMTAARRLSMDQLVLCLDALARTDARLKGQEPSFSAADALERMVLEMVEVVRKMPTIHA